MVNTRVLLKRIVLSIFFVLFTCSFAGEVLFLINRDYEPFSYEKNGQLQGYVVELLSTLSERVGEQVHMRGMTFEQAYSLLLSEEEYAIPTLVFTPERKALFQWVGPIAIALTQLYTSPFLNQKVGSLEEAKKAGSVGVVKDYYSTRLLESEGFKNLVYYENEKKLLEELIDGTINLAPFDDTVLSYLLEGRSASFAGLGVSVPLNLDMMYIGFSKKVPPETVNKWQTRLDELKETAVFENIYRKWLPGNPVPGFLTLLTEEYPPVTYTGEDGNTTGFVTHIVKELLKRNELRGEPILVPWSIGYELALHLPGILLFSMDQTPQRKELFEWIGPVGRNTAYLYARSDSNLSIETIESAKSISSIATTKNWWTEQWLRDRGFINLTSALHPSQNVRQLMNGEAELAIFTDLTVRELFEESGYTIDGIKPLLEVQSNDFYIAASKGTNPSTIYKLQKTLDEMKKDGSFEMILRKDVPNVMITPLLFKTSTPEVIDIKIGSHLISKGSVARIHLPVLSESGGMWSVELSNPEVLVYLGEENNSWLFRPIQAGSCAVVFSLYQSAEAISPSKVYTIEFVVE
jgi:polar amino acid transport system substrate-binding protein